MAQAYEHLAAWFETLNDDCGYSEWTDYLLDRLKELGAGKRGLELGCGSGAFSRALAKAGYCMTGADISAPMLTRAAELSREEGLPIEFVRADAASLSVPKPFDFILSPNDCYNYVPPHRLATAFQRAAAALNRGGIFWFDLSSAHKLRTKVANNTFVDDRDEVTYLSFNRLSGDRVEMEVSLFVRGKDGRYDRLDESHTQFIHEKADVLTALGSRFEILSVEGHLGEREEESERLNFICRKR